MPLTDAEFAIAVATLLGIAVAIVLLNSWRRKAGWWLLAAIVAFIVIGNAIEELTGNSPMF